MEIKSGKNMSNWDDLQEAILSIFEEEKINLEESFADRRTYSVLQSAVKSLGEVFASLEKRKLNKTKQGLSQDRECLGHNEKDQSKLVLRYSTLYDSLAPISNTRWCCVKFSSQTSC